MAGARSWAERNGFKAKSVERSEEYYRIRQRRPSDFRPKSFRTIEFDTGVKAIVGHLKRGRRPNPGKCETFDYDEQGRPLSGPPQMRIEKHPDGIRHTKSTIKTMAKLVRKAAHSYPVRSLAVRITADVPSKQPALELAALYRWVRDNIRYRLDPVGLEWVQTPERTLQEKAGDCDDITVLIAALAESIGYKTRFITVGPSHSRQCHIAAQAHCGRRWITLDPVLEKPQPTTAPRPDFGTFGKTATGVKRLWSSNTGRPLGSPVSPLEATDWPTVDAFPPDPPRPTTPTAAALMPPPPPVAYRSANATAAGRPYKDAMLAGPIERHDGGPLEW